MKKAFAPRRMVRGFSLVELIVVITIIVVLLLVTSNFLISVLRQNNEININNEIRNEANRLVDQISTDLRSSKCETIGTLNGNSILSLYNVSDCLSGGPTPFAIYSINGSLNMLKGTSVLNSNIVKIRNCTTCACTSSSAGFVVTETLPSSRVYDISLSLTQSKNNPRADFCGKITTQKTISPRNRN